MPRIAFKLKPTHTILLSFLLLVGAGAALLRLPAASAPGKSVTFLDSLFTSASAVCVTGLTVVQTSEQWSMFGKVVLLCLFQIGGLGLPTFYTMFWLMLGKHITLKERMAIQTNFSQETTQGMIQLVRRVISVTLVAELAGAAALSARFAFDYPFPDSVFMGLFHAVSAFCNAGFDLVGGQSLAPYAADVFVNVAIMALTSAGALGFIVWKEVTDYAKRRLAGSRERSYSLHSKLVFASTAAIVAVGFAFILAAERDNALAGMPLHEKALAALFQSVATRTAGMTTLNFGSMRENTQFLMSILMFVGGSPVGTSGGVKTVAVAIVMISVASVVRGGAGSGSMHAFKRSLPMFILQKAIAVLLLGLFSTIIGAMALSVTEGPGVPFLSLLFEAASAFGTAGASTGITAGLSAAGKLVLTVLMFVGRLGPMTVAFSLTMLHAKGGADVGYAEERPIIG